MSAPRCLVADDHPALPTAVCDYLQANGFAPLLPVHDAPAAVAAAQAERPEVALVDYRMPGFGGDELLRRLRSAVPEMRLVVYTAEADAALAREALGAGADAVVLKEAPLADLVRALTSVLRGHPYVDPGISADAVPGTPACELTQREQEVLRELAEGRSHEEIGRSLGIGIETVRTHARKAADRLGAKTRTQAVASAIRRGLI